MIYLLFQISRGHTVGSAGAFPWNAEDNQLAYYCINRVDEPSCALLLYLAVCTYHGMDRSSIDTFESDGLAANLLWLISRASRSCYLASVLCYFVYKVSKKIYPDSFIS